MGSFDRLKKACPGVQPVKLSESLACTGADGKLIVVKEAANLRISLRTATGKVRLVQPVECLNIPGDSTEFLMRRDILRVLGIDVDRQVERFVENEMNDANEHEHEHEHDDEPSVGNASGMESELRTATEELISKAVDKGFPQDHVPSLRRIVNRFDIWRLRLGDDPPARVSPMRIRLKTDATPYRCKARNRLR